MDVAIKSNEHSYSTSRPSVTGVNEFKILIDNIRKLQGSSIFRYGLDFG